MGEFIEEIFYRARFVTFRTTLPHRANYMADTGDGLLGSACLFLAELLKFAMHVVMMHMASLSRTIWGRQMADLLHWKQLQVQVSETFKYNLNF